MENQHAVTVVFYLSTANQQAAEDIVNYHLINRQYLTYKESFQIVDVSKLANG